MNLILSLEEHLSPERDLIRDDFVKFVKSLWGRWSLFPRVEMSEEFVCLFGNKTPTEWKAEARMREKSFLMIYHDIDSGFSIV